MKVKEIDRTSNVAWSPASQHPIYLAAGTAAQQLDATFSTTASLEIYGLNLTEPGLDMSLKGSISSDCRFHKIAWTSHGMGTSDYPNGVIVGGADGGNLFMFDPAKLIKGEMALICQRDKHTGPVSALDFNPFQSNLLASGANESEIFIWDLNSPNSPMTPGAKSQQGEIVTCVAWNRQVQHILASTFPARCVVWDLRKNEPIIKVSDTISRMRCKAVAWHPEVATQMCLASEDDHTPVIQLWDLRFATSPLKSLENHLRGVLSIAWCPQDPDLLLSCGKDNRILCWNPNSNIQGGEIVWELPTSNQWSFDVSWCPRNPAIVASSSFDGHVSIYSLMGGQQQIQTSSKIVDAFPGTEPYGQSSDPHIEHRGVSVTLKTPPKWLRKPVGASFAFGGKLVTFENVKSTQTQAQTPKIVYVSQIVTETELISRSLKLEAVLSKGNFLEFCQNKLSTCTSAQDEKIWKFVKANFDENPRSSFLNLLGYDPQEVGNAISNSLSNRPVSRGQGDDGVDAEELALRMSALGSAANSLRASPNIAANLSSSQTPDSLPAVLGNGASAFDTIASLHSEDISPGSPYHSFTISTDDDIDGLISKALLIGNIEVAVNLCIKDGRYADAIILAMAGGKDLLNKTQKKYFKISKGELSKLIASVVNEDWVQVMQTCDIKCWKEALAACLTYAKSDFPTLCVTLGSRLEAENNKDDLFKAMLCYICAGNVEKLVECWVKTTDTPENPIVLQDLVELAMILGQAVEKKQPQIQISSGTLAKQLVNYANILAAQGSLKTALTYLGDSNDLSIVILKDRLQNAQRDTGITTSSAQITRMETKPVQVAPLMSTPSVSLPTNSSVMPILPSQQIKPVGYPTPISNPCNFAYPPTTHPQQIPTSSHPHVSHPYPVGVPPLSPTVTVPPVALPVQTQTNVYSKGRLADELQFSHHTDSPSLQPPFPTSSFSSPTEPFSYQSTYPKFGEENQQIKGHLSQRYPTVPQDPSVNSAVGYNQPSYGFRPQVSTTVTGTYAASQNITNQPTAYPNFSSYNVSNAQTNGYSMSTTSQFPSNYSSQISTYSSAYSTLPGQPPNPIVSNAPINYLDSNMSWNDPPQVKSAAKGFKQEYEPPAPITRPIFSVPELEPTAPPNYQANNYMAPLAPPSTVGNINAPQQMLQPAMQEIQPVQVPAPPEPPKPKQPIPAENQVLFEVFDNLRNRCLASATMPQIKRKLDDVARKLESLYDKLRDNDLSQATILGLHQIVQAIQQGDYQSALATHAQIVSMGAFAEIGSFMPGLKILLQTSQQLNVYPM